MLEGYGAAGTNFFKVKDPAAFEKWVDSMHDLILTKDPRGRYALRSIDEGYEWPRERYRKEAHGYVEINFYEELGLHLHEESVALLAEAELDEFLRATAVLVNSDGIIKRVHVTNSEHENVEVYQ